MKKNVLNLLVRLKNASLDKNEKFTLEYSKHYQDILKFLYEKGVLTSMRLNTSKTINTPKKMLTIKINLYSKKGFSNLKIISTSSKVSFFRYNDLVRFNEKNKIILFSTTSGLLSAEGCKKIKVGGKAVLSI